MGFAYDARGNMSSDGVNAYGYDILNRLISRGSATLGYDPAGRLVQTVNGATTTRMLYDGAAMIGEYNASNALQRRFVHGPGMDEPLVWYEGSGTSDRRWLLADERGSIVAVTNAAGAATNINAYDEYGVPGAGNVGRFQYTGQMWLSEVGVYHYKTRAYAPALGRFLQTDPIGTAGGVNLYAYVGGDPVNFTDPWGLRNDCLPSDGDACIPVTGTRCSADPACLRRLQQEAERAAGQQWVRDMQEQSGRRTDGLSPSDADEGVEDEIVVTGRRRPPPPWWLRGGAFTLGFAAWAWQDDWTRAERCQDAPFTAGCATAPDPEGCQRNQDNEVARCQGLGLTPSED